VAEIVPGDRIITRAWNEYQLDNYFNVAGEASINSQIAARVTLQVIQAVAKAEG